ncbi:MAG TPA: 3-deoxy-7-phosphoheptulonate synthase [Candidatus Krumholzibacteria bacterium]|nr:3-deoxy-7-phosphoheptulonate synthase [Candidatus Krumholzibacteria bacterium]HPD70400.1 3-deoxy-7-phosphoheptulonate synthase [Candidatus Krumholzibacteria bacterium]HRY39900.1 3-deoxy-7-phosphoheptulonate synthase [Candidatus Krumholzibacteria bacterium]
MNSQRPTEDVNVVSVIPIVAPEDLKRVFPAPDGAYELVQRARRAVIEAINGRSDRLVAIVGPCSIHDPDAALDYARRLAGLARRVEDRLLVIMRMYFEKPRTTVGWKGMISDPDLDGSNSISKGLGVARRLLCEASNLGLPVATETLSPTNPQYYADLISWGGIGARTSQSQTHREVVSGLSFPVGFKNPTSGNLGVALDAMEAARHPHTFTGISHDGRAAVIATRGNRHVHLVLRGADDGPNYGAGHVAEASRRLAAKDLAPGILVDCSHGNSRKDHTQQAAVLEDVLAQVAGGQRAICGFMLESFLEAGNQDPTSAAAGGLEYGKSITDACLDWETTEHLLLGASAALAG